MTALVPRSTAIVPAHKKASHVNVVHCASEGVAADVRVSRAGRRRRRSFAYTVRLATAKFNVTGRLIGVARCGDIEDLGELAVASGSIGSARLAVPAERVAGYDAIYLEIRSDDLLLRVEAPRLPERQRARGFGVAATLIGLGICAAGASLLGSSISRGTVPEKPATVVASNPVVASRPVAAPARVLSFSARRDFGAGGETMLASYLAVGERGTVALVAPSGKVVSSAPFVHVGTSRLAIADAYRTTPLLAKLTIHRGTTEAVASVVVPPGILPAFARIPGVTTPEEAAQDRSGQPMSSGIIGVQGRAIAGREMTVRLEAQSTPVHVELQDASGGMIAQRDVAAGTTLFTMALPSAPTVQTYYLVVRYARSSGGEETVVQPITAARR
jgi:hypothetical protein